jgi:predicted RNase H-like nuclease
VDGCPAGWLCLVERAGSADLAAHVYTTVRDLLAATHDCEVVAVDIPIGLTDAGPRRCDVEARRLLGPRRSSVFPAPVRATLDATSYLDACERSAAAHGKRLSRQAFAILDRIRDVDAALRTEPDARERVYEVHPELCFYEWNDARPMPHSKHTSEGFRDRLALVTRDFGPEAYQRVRTSVRRGQATDDDILDAFAALWTARRICAGQARRVPEVPPVDACGLPMRMLA